MLIGLTGGIGCGKSSVLEIMSKLGWKTIDSDRICHAIYSEKDGEPNRRMVNRWGTDILGEDGRPQRRAVAEIVFKDEKELEWLNSLLHPEVYGRAMEIYRASRTPTIFDVPLLFESGKRGIFDAVVCVWTDKSIQMDRLLKRGMDRAAAERRISLQMPAEKKLELSEHAIVNNGGLSSLEEQCGKLDNILLKLYSQGENERRRNESGRN